VYLFTIREILSFVTLKLDSIFFLLDLVFGFCTIVPFILVMPSHFLFFTADFRISAVRQLAPSIVSSSKAGDCFPNSYDQVIVDYFVFASVCLHPFLSCNEVPYTVRNFKADFIVNPFQSWIFAQEHFAQITSIHCLSVVTVVTEGTMIFTMDILHFLDIMCNTICVGES
jgi:hypothetical protein